MIRVTLLPDGTTPNPLRTLYTAFRVDYSKLTPEEVQDEIVSGKITEQRMLDFIEERFKVNHASPLQQVYFEFGISGVSRAFSHQFVRHHVGIDIEQQSQRYTVLKGDRFQYTTPDTIAEKPMLNMLFTQELERIRNLYEYMIDEGVPGEDARFILPNAANTNLKCTINFLELQHMCDIRQCTRAQWEFQAVMAQMHARVARAYPWLGKKLGPKCMSYRLGYCDEPFGDYQKCPISAHRPHKSDVIPGVTP